MFVPWFAPFLVPVFVTMVIVDKMSGGAVNSRVDDRMKRDVEDRFRREPGHYKSER